jgi:uncharacterized repeat protein (TIGR02543 family)
MRGKFVSVVVFLAFLAMLALPMAFTPIASAADGTPPVWSVDDNWVYNCSYDSSTGVTNTGEMTTKVTNTTGANYTLLGDYIPDALRVDATTGFPVTVLSADVSMLKANMQFQDQYAAILAFGFLPVNATIVWTYDSPVPSWPLSVGDTYNFTKHTWDALGIVDKTVSREGKVLGIESVTVPAGTFSCLRIVEYDPASPSNYTYEHWFNETVVGSDVKMIDRETFKGVETRELKSTSYVPPDYTLTVNALNGSVTKAPDLAQYPSGTPVTFTAVPNAGYHFTGWSGDASGPTSPVTITMDGNKTVAANFAINAPAPAFYFAEGTTRTNFQEYLCLGNSGDQAASAQVTYMFTDGTTKDAVYSVPANSRSTVDVNSEVGAGKDVSISILTSSPNLVAERPMYFNYNGQWTGGSDALGAVAPNTKWYFAEGNTLPEFDQYVTVLNPGNAAADLIFHYMVEGQGEKDVPGQVGAHSRATFKTRDQIGNGKHVSLYLKSTRGVVAERPMYQLP